MFEFNILSHQKNVNQNNSETPSYPCNMTNIKNIAHNLALRECGVKRKLFHYRKCKLAQPFWILVWQILRKLGNKPSQNSAIFLVGVYIKDVQPCHKDTCLTTFIAEMFYHTLVPACLLPTGELD